MMRDLDDNPVVDLAGTCLPVPDNTTVLCFDGRRLSLGDVVILINNGDIEMSIDLKILIDGAVMKTLK